MYTVKRVEASLEKPAVLRVAAYCRVSTDSADQLQSYASQIRAYTELIRRHDGWSLVDIYADEGLTGTRMDTREEFQRMISDCQRGKIDKILVKSISRFARNTKDCLSILRMLSAMNVSVKFEDDHIDTETLTSEMMVSVFSAIAQQESISISQNLRMSYQRRMKRGEFLTANRPLGYDLMPKCGLVINEEEAEIVRWIFNTYLEGKSSREIAVILMELGVKTSDGRSKWYGSSVRYVLSNEKYIGDTLCQKNYTSDTLPYTIHKNRGTHPQYYLENSHEPIISRETFEKVQALRRSRVYQRNLHHTDSPFWRKIVCGGCGTAFIRRENENGYVYFVCQKHHQNKSLCGVGRVAEVSLYDAFVRMYNRLRQNLEIVFQPALGQLDSLSEALHQNSPELVSLNLEIADASEQSYKLGKLLRAGHISADVGTAKQKALDAKLKTLRNKRRQLLRNEAIDNAAEAIRDTYSRILDGPEELTAFQESLFADLVQQIYIDPDNGIRFLLYGGIELKDTIRRLSR